MGNLYRDLVSDQGEKLAVTANAEVVAKMLGYSDGPVSTPVTQVIIYQNGYGRQIVIREGKYASATFAHAACLIHAHECASCRLPETNVSKVPIDDRLIHFLRQFMGQRVMGEAEDSSGRHTFVREVLAAEGGVLYVFMR